MGKTVRNNNSDKYEIRDCQKLRKLQREIRDNRKSIRVITPQTA
jgi:hypothetical protein